MRRGADIGLVSEAGCPAVADPGAKVVDAAHRLGITVKPWVGPSSILLGLMASGLDGQRFAASACRASASAASKRAIRSYTRMRR
ncbi:hypothetical protein [Lactiplantibacillus plantarum]|uniref:hypothetical protein n=1 Tax=Lactiplantibacillus plantarum TaxID=1590 RepID=UPI004045B0C4